MFQNRLTHASADNTTVVSIMDGLNQAVTKTYEEVLNMRTTMQRTITISTIHFATTEVKDGAVDVITQEPITVVGKVTQSKANKHIKGFNNPIVTKIEYTENTYMMNLDDFIKQAELTESDSVSLDDNEGADNE